MCVKECKRGCHLDEYPGKLPLYLTIFWWDCEDECKYQCMHNVTAANLQSNKAVQQFYGKVSSVWNFEISNEILMVKVPCNSVAKWLRHQTEIIQVILGEFKCISDHWIDLLQQGPWFKSWAVLLQLLVCLLAIRILKSVKIIWFIALRLFQWSASKLAELGKPLAFHQCGLIVWLFCTLLWSRFFSYNYSDFPFSSKTSISWFELIWPVVFLFSQSTREPWEFNKVAVIIIIITDS